VNRLTIVGGKIMTESGSPEETEIRVVLEQWAAAVRATNVEAISKHYAEDIVAYDAIAKLQFVGKEAYRKHWDYCVTLCPTMEMVFELKDPVIHADKSVAFSFSLSYCGGKDEQGKVQASWMRVTRGYRKIDNQWLAVHEHFSSPFDMESNKALFTLEP